MAVDPAQLYADLKSAGFDKLPAAAFVAIAGRESGYRPEAANTNAGTGDYSMGLFQINLYPGGHGGWLKSLQAAGMADPVNDLRTEAGSILGARTLYAASGLHPWGGYKGKPWNYGTNIPAAAAATGGEVSAAELYGFQGAQPGAGLNGSTASPTGAGPGSPSNPAQLTGATDDCLWKITMPGSIPNFCFHEGWGRAMLGAVSMVGGAVLILGGLVLIAGASKGGRAALSIVPVASAVL